MSLEARFTVGLGTLHLEVDLEVGEEIVAILGPNGAGKTTLLRVLAGLEPVDSGRIVLDGEILDEPASGTFVRPERRSVGMVFQDYLLFPFLSARENVAFGLRARRVRRREARRRATEWLDRVGLAGQEGELPTALSGGQAQRVALARSLVGEPRLLLLDEPLAALDARTRLDIRHELREYLAQVDGARLIVTHDPVDAFALASRVVILEGGQILQDGPMADIVARPRSRYVAELVGLNLLRGDARDGTVTLPGGAEVVVADREASGPVCLTVHPHAVSLYLGDVHGSVRNHWPGRVVDLDHLGSRVRVRIDGPVPIVAEVTPAAVRELDLVPGRTVFAVVKATEVEVYPA